MCVMVYTWWAALAPVGHSLLLQWDERENQKGKNEKPCELKIKTV